MNRALLAAAAALIVALGGAALILRPSANVGPPGSPVPTGTQHPTSTSATANRGFQPPELLRNWVGVPHDFPGTSQVRFLTLGFQSGQLSVNVNLDKDYFTSTAFVAGPNTLELSALSNGCDLGTVGHYRWSLSPGGTLLHLAVVDDACSDRSAALAGDWHAANCKDTTDMCWGDLEAGTYPTLFYGPRLDPSQPPVPVYGGVTFTVPDGWALAGDHTSDFRLVRSSDYAQEGPDGPSGEGTGIEGWIRPVANVIDDCDPAPEPNFPDTPEGIIHAIQRHLYGVISPPNEITIDGSPGRWLDVSLPSDWTHACSGRPTLSLVTEAVGGAGPVGDEPYLVAISGETRMRLIFLDISQPELHSSHMAMILVTAPDRETFDSFINEAMPIVQSFHFH